MARDWLLYVDDILNNVKHLEEFKAQIQSVDELQNNQMLLLASERCLEIIGEAVKSLPQSVKNTYTAVPWKNIAGMRDILAHGYFSVSPAIIWETMHNDLSLLKAAAEAMLASSGENDL